ncbi:hypothetical protein AB4Y32_02980 [Paraburkholderia phymatum]|uniref:Uncharacterized protein n=1 Tax=Paraburkholderia phymatum TaxID=148447 RepID=A0ACC6TTU4_9BURK
MADAAFLLAACLPPVCCPAFYLRIELNCGIELRIELNRVLL